MLVELEAITVRVAGQVEPVTAPALSIVGRSEQPVDHVLPGSWPGVGEKRFDLGRGRRQADEVQRHPAQELLARRTWCGGQAGDLELGEDECVDGGADPGG